jgi:hypothetical protein
MNSTSFQRDQTTPLIDDNERRHLARSHSGDLIRRAVSSTAAARVGEPNELRSAVLASLNERLQSMLAELRALE